MHGARVFGVHWWCFFAVRGRHTFFSKVSWVLVFVGSRLFVVHGSRLFVVHGSRLFVVHAYTHLMLPPFLRVLRSGARFFVMHTYILLL